MKTDLANGLIENPFLPSGLNHDRVRRLYPSSSDQ